MQQEYKLLLSYLNHLKDWDGHRDDEVSTDRAEKKRVLRQKTLSLERFLFENIIKNIRILT